MNAGTMYFKIVTRKLQGNGGAYQFILLAGPTSKLSHSTADFMETLSPNHVLTQEEIVATVAKLQKVGSYGDSKSITNPDVEKKLNKLFDITVAEDGTPVNLLPSFAALGIGCYL
jgi:hypothetical protein